MNFDATVANNYDLIFYTNGCSWIENIYLNRVVQQQLPNVLHINRGIGGNGNWQIINRTITDLKYLTQSKLPVVSYISFSEVGRNKKELSLINPTKYNSLNDYFKDILLQEYKILTQELDKLKINYHVTTSFINNCFNQNKSIIDYCVDPYGEQAYSLYPLEYMKDHNSLFKFDIKDYINEIEKWDRYFTYMENSNVIDETYHPNNVSVYQHTVDFVQSFL